MSERTRAAESLFAVHYEEEEAPPRVLYAESSAFLARHRNNNSNTEEEPAEVSLFDVLKDSQLWQELRLGSQRKSYTYETLPVTAKQPKKGRLKLAKGAWIASHCAL